MTQATTVVVERPRRSRRRRVLAGIALVLACLSILLTTMAVWTHQVALNTDRFTSLVGDVVTDPAVTDPISARISVQVVDALEVQRRLEDRLPDAIKPLAGALTAAATERIDQRLRVALQNPRLQEALVGTISFTHAQVVRLLRGESEVVSIVDGYLTLDVFPVVGAALTELQSMGLIPADVQLPDLTSAEAPDVLAQRLETSLGVTLPADFGTIRLMPAERLATARTIVQAFDVIVILLVILSVILAGLALWLAGNRRRMLIYLGIGVIVAFLLARLAMGAAENVIVGGIADQDVAGAARAIVDMTLQDLRSITVLILIATVVLVIAAYLWGRPRWVVATTSYVTDTAGRAGSAAGAAASSGAAGVAGRAPDRATVETTVRENRSAVERYGIAVIVFILVWIAIGLEIALLGAALVIAFQLVLRAIDGGSDDVAGEVAVAEAPATADAPSAASWVAEVTPTEPPAPPAATETPPAEAPPLTPVAPVTPATPATPEDVAAPTTGREAASRPQARRQIRPQDHPTAEAQIAGRLIARGRARSLGRSPACTQTRTGASSFSMRMAVALNSAVPDFGSVASIVSRLTATSSWKCIVMNVRPGRSDGSMRTGTSTWPRRETTRTISPSARS